MADRILIVEDEATLVAAVSYALEREGFIVGSAADGRQALAAFDQQRPDLVILDLMLPHLSGWELFRAFRKQRPDLPVIMLTARADEADRVAGLEMGADDYVTKPFSMRELVARVRAVLRRQGAPQPDSIVEHSGVRLDPERHLCTVGGTPVELSPREFALLLYLMRHRGRVRSRAEILAAVWEEDTYLDDRTVDVHIRWLRMKIEADPAQPRLLQTVRGVGYRFTELP